MKNFKILQCFLACTLIWAATPNAAHSTVFDAAEYLNPGDYSGALLGDMVLSNPTSEVAQWRLKRGFNTWVNLQAIAGVGSSNRMTEFGAQTNINFYPDIPGQIGVTLVGAGSMIHRRVYNSVVIYTAPMIHKITTGFGDLPMNSYLAIPFTLDLHVGQYTTGTELVFGFINDANRRGSFYYNSEVGFSINHADTYISFGVGYRFNRPEPKEEKKEELKEKAQEAKDVIKGKIKDRWKKVKTIEEENE